tara:strand:- start:8114 stop:8365 length:252 start_codon:yes stop_codon:yes gene_type:complete
VSDEYSHDADATDPQSDAFENPRAQMVEEMLDFRLRTLVDSFNEAINYARTSLKAEYEILTDAEIENEYFKMIGSYSETLNIH